MPFIKSHSNYVLKAKHQDVNDGTIFERDITTIGAVNQFTPDQTPIYRSNNFIITVRNDGRPSNQYNTTKWKENDYGDIWTLQTISGMVSDFEEDNDTKIVLKQDYYDFRDFAYYGSLTELFRASVTDILARFPGELYVTNNYAYYTVKQRYDFDTVEENVPLGYYGEDGEPNYYFVSNPFNINIYSKYKPTDADPLKYFADNGFLNYEIGVTTITGSTTGCSINPNEHLRWEKIVDWEVEYHDPCVTKVGCTCDELVIEIAKCNCDTLNAKLLEASTRMMANRANETEGDSGEGEDEDYSLYRKVAEVKITGESGSTYTIYAYLDDDNKVVYLSDKENFGVHIRPSRKFLDIFYNESDNFQRLLVNENTHYEAIFSVIRENDYGYYREFVPFQFPTADGDYNLDATTYGFNAYTTQMVQIGEYYDENFTDNLWRSMTHEAIKNFDWSYTREYEVGDEEEYVIGGQRIQKALRIFAREFDEIISYINNIKNLNRVTYDERGNIPDYFLTDVVENEGWDVKLVYPYELTEYYRGTKTVVDPELYEEGGNCVGQLDNSAYGESGATKITREFSQNSTKKIKPYTKWMVTDGSEEGYFVACNNTGCTSTEGDVTTSMTPTIADVCGGDVTITLTKTFEEGARIPIDLPCEYLGTNNLLIRAEGDAVYNDGCALGGKGAIKNRIKSYTDETEWTYQQANNEFLRRLKVNSRHIWRHKGTVEGIEMILAMFGMKSKRWVDAKPDWIRNCKYDDGDGHQMWDFDVKEYTSFTNRIEETWDVVHQDYRINWINSTKVIRYDNRFASNYTKYGANENISYYQGIPVSYRDAYLNPRNENTTGGTGSTYDPYLKYGDGDNDYYINTNNEKVIKRYLYPYFNKYEQLDGNPYFQMDGGWLSKMIVGFTSSADSEDSGDTIWNFQFDVDDNIVYSKYLGKGYVDEDGFVNDNKPLFKETVRNIRRVDNIASLLTQPLDTLYDGVICNVTRIEKDAAVVDNVVYPIVKEWYKKTPSTGDTADTTGEIVSYISLVKTDGFIRVGTNKFFDTTIIVYDIDGGEHLYNVEDIVNGGQLKAYIVNDSFICKEDENGYYSISNFQILEDDKSSNFSNYFILDDVNYADELARLVDNISADTTTSFTEDYSTGTTSGSTNWTSGWRRLTFGEKDYLKINTITNYYEGNNPHNGNMVYDNGHEYFTYYNRIFKYAADNDVFDERCYEDYYATLDKEIVKYGFDNLIEKNEDILQYDTFLIQDSKIHYFGNYKTKNGEPKSNGVPNIDKIWIYGDNMERISGIDTKESGLTGGYDVIYKNETTNIDMYNLSAETSYNESADTASTATTSEGGWIERENPYNALTARSDVSIDEVTNQIVNNKIFDITFRLHNIWYTKEGQEELKYIDDVVMNYLTQMIPSTTILRVKYDLTDVIPTVIIIDDDEEEDYGCSTTKTETVQYANIPIEKNCTGKSRKVPIDPIEKFGIRIDEVPQAGGVCSTCYDKCSCDNLNAKKLQN